MTSPVIIIGSGLAGYNVARGLRRLDAAREEMRHCGDFDYVIMNQEFARAVDDLTAIVRAARLTAPRQMARHAQLLQRLLEH